MTKKETPISEFRALSQKDKLKLLRRDGVYVGKLKEGKAVHVLFQLYSFYAEVRYKEYRKQIDQIIVSDNMSVLKPYINQIKLDDLNNTESK